MRVLFAIALVVYSIPAFPCFAPISGPEYDAQIKIVELDDPNHYQVSVPRFMEELPNEAVIILAYSSSVPRGIPVYRPSKILDSTTVDERLVAKFVVEKRPEEKPYIVVMWWPEDPGTCGIQANSGFLEVI